MSDTPSIRARLARRFDPVELRAIKKLWVRHSIAEDARDIDGLIATLAPDCVYEIVPTGRRWEGHDGARAFYTELFAAFPDNRFSLTEIVVGPQGVFEAAQLTGTNLGPWAGVPASGLPVSLQVLILFPVGSGNRNGSPASGSGSTGEPFDPDGPRVRSATMRAMQALGRGSSCCRLRGRPRRHGLWPDVHVVTASARHRPAQADVAGPARYP